MSKNHTDGRAFGFTLIEVTVALAIAALGLGVLMAAAGTGLGQSKLADQYIEATRRAQSRLALLDAAIQPQPGTQFGDDGGGYSWQSRISDPVRHAGSKERAGSDELGLYSVEVTLTWRAGAGEKNVTLRSQRVAHVSNANE